MHHTATQGDYAISTDPALLDINVIHGYLVASYWSPNIPREIVERAIAHSMCFGVYYKTEQGTQQVGFGRVVTDQATFAYLADVFILEEHRKKGLSKFLVKTIQAHPALQTLRRFTLSTLDAHSLYAQFGFKAPPAPERLMEIGRPITFYRDMIAAQQAKEQLA